MRVVAAASPVEGHVRPVLQAAAHLLGRGHPVVMTTAPRFGPMIERSGVEFVPLAERAYVDVDTPEFRAARVGDESGWPDQLNHDFTRLYADALPAQHEALQELLTEDSVIVADAPFTGAWPSVLGAGIRPALALGLGVSPVVLRSEDTTMMNGPLGHDEAARLLHRQANEGLVAMLGGTQARIEAGMRACGVTGELPFFFDGHATAWDVMAQLCVPEFEYARRDAPAQLRYVGPMPVPRYAADALPDWWPDTDTDRPVVLVTQGTVSNEDLTELVVPTIEALADADVLVVATVGRDPAALHELVDHVPANVRTAAFVPYSELLPRVSVMVTNGGYGATQQALGHGIPVVVGGTWEDKPCVAARVEHSGAGVNLHTGKPTATQVSDAVRAVVDDERYRAGARRMADAIARSDALATIAEIVESAPGARRSVGAAERTAAPRRSDLLTR